MGLLCRHIQGQVVREHEVLSNTSVRRKTFALYVFIICPGLRFWVSKYRFEYFSSLGDDSSSLAVETGYKSNTNRTLYKHGWRF